jgi:ABC-2 type transport system ATP-binding protein
VLFDDLSLRENLNFHASLNGVRWRRRKRLRAVLDLVSLRGEERKLVRDSSGGMRRRLALAATLVHDPPVLVLDEPTAGIDPLLRRQIWEHFRDLRDRGRTIVVTTQHVNEAANCDVVVVLDEGQVIAVGTPEELHRMAYGGEVVSICFGRSIDDQLLDQLRDVDGVVDVRWIDARQAQVIVDDAGAALRRLQEKTQELGVPVDDAAEVPVDWDETFIQLVEAHGSRRGEEDEA